jgi:protein-tyrosine phosphatase
MHEIHPNLLWIGHALDVREPRPLFDAGITAVIDVAYEEQPAQIPRQLTYCRFPLNDGGGNDPGMLLQTLMTTTDLLRTNTPTIIACSAGLSRSPTVAAFALAHHLDKKPDDLIAGIAERKSLDLNPHLWAEMLTAFKKLRPHRHIDNGWIEGQRAAPGTQQLSDK